jgi:hypothetical protein
MKTTAIVLAILAAGFIVAGGKMFTTGPGCGDLTFGGIAGLILGLVAAVLAWKKDTRERS